VVENIEKISTMKEFGEYRSLLFMTSFLLTNKGKSLNHCTLETIKYGENRFELDNFDSFLNSNYKKTAEDRFWTSMEAFIRKESGIVSQKNNYLLSHEDLNALEFFAGKETLYIQDLDERIAKKLNDFHQFAQFDEVISSQPHLVKATLEITVTCGFAIRCQQYFPFIDEKTGEQFQWGGFYEMLPTLSSSQIKALLSDMELNEKN
jgi:hypothetical protein